MSAGAAAQAREIVGTEDIDAMSLGYKFSPSEINALLNRVATALVAQAAQTRALRQAAERLVAWSKVVALDGIDVAGWKTAELFDDLERALAGRPGDPG